MFSNNGLYYIYYSRLTENQKRVYDQICRAAESGITEVKPSVTLHVDQLTGILPAIVFDHPEYFWLTTAAQYWHSDNKVTKICLKFNDLVRNLTENRRTFDRTVTAILTGIRGKNKYEAEKIIHDYLVNTVSYQSGRFDQTAYSALIEKRSVCAGYSRAFQLLMQKAGIPCYYCSGTGLSKRTGRWEPHAWNIICLDGGYYNVDLTWDDGYDSSSADYISYQYYNCTDRMMSSTHRRDADCRILPACNAIACSFEKLYGMDWQTSLLQQSGKKSGISGNLKMIQTQREYQNYVLPFILHRTRNEIKVTFGVKGNAVYQSLGKWFQEMFDHPQLKRNGYHLRTEATDFGNGYYKVQQTITIQ